MEFTYSAYTNMIKELKRNNYQFCNYHNESGVEKSVILRHDIDFSLDKALEIAKLENKLQVKSTFFISISTNFYNVFSKLSYEIISQIIELGHDIGLHFDESRYEINTTYELELFIESECKILKSAIRNSVNSVSMHRPSRWILDSKIEFQNCVNSYSNKYFSEYKYVSDSRMNWREDVLDIIKNNNYNKIHILTHPFWYSEGIEDMNYKIMNFLNTNTEKISTQIRENITNFIF